MPTPNRHAGQRSRWTFRLLAIGLGFAVAVGGLEVGARVLAFAAEEKQIVDWERVAAAGGDRQRGKVVQFGDMIAISRFHDVIYQLLPNLDVVYEDRRFTTNGDGQRGPPVPRQKPPGTIRVVGLGDSVMCGQGVDDGQEYLQVMQRRFDAAGLPHRVEVVNTAVGGFNTTMEVAMLENIGFEWQPDIVVIDFVRNDYSLPNFIVARSDFWSLRRSWLLAWAKAMVSGGDGGFGPLQPPPREQDGRFATTFETAPPEYRHMVGPASYARAMARLRELQIRFGFRVMVTMHRHDDPWVREVCANNGFPFVRANDAVDAYMRGHGIREYLGSPLTVSDQDPHPSALQHEILGAFYADWLLQSGWLR